jgi:hypothetical protein
VSNTDLLSLPPHREKQIVKIQFDNEQTSVRPPMDIDLYNRCVDKTMEFLNFKEDPKDKRKLDRYIKTKLPNLIKLLTYPEPGAFTAVKLTISDMMHLNDAGVLKHLTEGSAIDKAKTYVSELKIIGEETLATGKVLPVYCYHPTVEHMVNYFTHCFNNHKGDLMARDLLFFSPMGLINKEGNVLSELEVADTMISGTYKLNGKWREFSSWMVAHNKTVNNTFSRVKYIKLLKMMLAMLTIKVIWDTKQNDKMTDISIMNHVEFILSSVTKDWLYA